MVGGEVGEEVTVVVEAVVALFRCAAFARVARGVATPVFEVDRPVAVVV